MKNRFSPKKVIFSFCKKIKKIDFFKQRSDPSGSLLFLILVKDFLQCAFLRHHYLIDNNHNVSCYVVCVVAFIKGPFPLRAWKQHSLFLLLIFPRLKLKRALSKAKKLVGVRTPLESIMIFLIF